MLIRSFANKTAGQLPTITGSLLNDLHIVSNDLFIISNESSTISILPIYSTRSRKLSVFTLGATDNFNGPLTGESKLDAFMKFGDSLFFSGDR